MDSRAFFKNEKYTNEAPLSKKQLLGLQQNLLEILKDFVEFAEKNNINYHLGGGSALGAYRHKGFIPWDDDVDINMPRKDYEKLLRLFPQKMKKYIIASPKRGKKHGMAHAQIKKKGTIYRSFNELSKKDEEAGIYIDIFVIENTYNEKWKRKIHGAISLIFGFLLTCKKTNEDYKYIYPYIKDNRRLSLAFNLKNKIGSLISNFDLDKLAYATQKIYSICKDEDSKYVTIPTGRKHFFGEMYKREDVISTRFAKFENLRVRLPKKIKTYLKKLYGKDYMKIPKNKERHPVMELKLNGLKYF